MSAAQQRIEEYLKQVRVHLRRVRKDQVLEIVAELRSHILESASLQGDVTLDGVNAAIQALGSPQDLAREYANDAVLARAETSRSPLRMLDSLFGWATVSVAGFLVLIITIAGYFLGIVCLMVALLKPFHPAAAGLWVLPNSPDDMEISVRMGFGTPPSNGHEIIGWWIVPLGLLVGCGLIVVMTRFALWCARMYRRSRPLPARG